MSDGFRQRRTCGYQRERRTCGYQGEDDTMDRRTTLKIMAGLATAGLLWASSSAGAAEPKTMATVVKEAGVPWFNILNQGLEEAGKAYNITTTMVGPVQVDPAQQVKLIDDLVAKK